MLCTLFCASCSGTAPDTSPGADSGALGSDAGAEGTGGPSGNEVLHAPSPSSRFVRLTHLQWELTVQDLLRLEEPPGLASTFIADSAGSGFSTDTALLEVPPDLWTDYQRGAEDLSQFVARDSDRLAAILPPEMLGGAVLDVELENASCDGLLGVEDLPSCCDGDGGCIDRLMIPESLQVHMESCDEDHLCAPKSIMEVVQKEGFFAPRECTSLAGFAWYLDGMPGACVSTCFPEIWAYESFFPQDVCDDGELCAPCIDPMTEESTGVCDIQIDCLAEMALMEGTRVWRDPFLNHFGRRAYRRPLEPEELERYVALFDQGKGLLKMSDPFLAGVEIVLR
ncbi:MAG: DUF1587 domain-containing protein, partial [Myxococcota bacterium]|nr:DUF1587 domain-containing protein [Myxococcota bacterium]